MVATRPSTCTSPSSACTAAGSRGAPSGPVRSTTSVVSASATLSCTTRPTTAASDAATYTASAGSGPVRPAAAAASAR